MSFCSLPHLALYSDCSVLSLVCNPLPSVCVTAGAYDTGMVRTWSIQAFSLVTLKGLLMKYLTAKAAANSGAADKAEADVQTGGMGLGLGMEAGPSEDEASNPFGSAGGALNFGFGAMAMSPITLMQEWQAHSSPFVSREFSLSYPCRSSARVRLHILHVCCAGAPSGIYLV